MSTTSVSGWVPIEWESEVLMRVQQLSAVEAFARGINMTSDTKKVPRSNGHSVGIGGTYSADSSTADTVLLDSFKFTGQDLLDEDELSDAESIIDVIGTKSAEWSTSYATLFDNSCLGVTAAANGTTVPFNSIYKVVKTTAGSYTANDNYVNFGGAASAAYDDLSSTLNKVESGEHWDASRALIIAHPAFRDVLRRTKDNDGLPIFVQGLAGTPDTLFGVPIHWSLGARTTAAPEVAPSAGNPLLIFCGNTDNMLRGDRLSVEAKLDVARAHDSTDETALKHRVRKAFVVGNVRAFSVMEKTA